VEKQIKAETIQIFPDFLHS